MRYASNCNCETSAGSLKQEKIIIMIIHTSSKTLIKKDDCTISVFLVYAESVTMILSAMMRREEGV